MRLSKFLYFGDLIASPIIIAALAGAALVGGNAVTTSAWLVALMAGIGAWTLIEYAVHRFVYHRVPIFRELHDAHHADPRGLIGTPSFLSIGLIVSLVFVPVLSVSFVAASGATSGMLIGYIAYMLVHHASHHWEPRPGGLLYRARLKHMLHHYHGTPGNYGVTTSFWDRVFATYIEPRRRVAPA
jgi:sterol desaturase/sphingolipid hydroxylase (fatty acid hydroxylase superfamily)